MQAGGADAVFVRRAAREQVQLVGVRQRRCAGGAGRQHRAWARGTATYIFINLLLARSQPVFRGPPGVLGFVLSFDFSIS